MCWIHGIFVRPVIRSQWMNHSSTQASYNRQQRKDKQTGSDVNDWTTRFIDFWSCLFVLRLLSIIRGLYWRMVHWLTSDPVCLSLRWCLLYEACIDETESEVNEWTTPQHRPLIIDNNVRTNKQDQKSMNEPLVNTGLVIDNNVRTNKQDFSFIDDENKYQH
jgi:hypothetical protein